MTEKIYNRVDKIRDFVDAGDSDYIRDEIMFLLSVIDELTKELNDLNEAIKELKSV